MPAASIQLNGFVGSEAPSRSSERTGFLARALSAIHEAQIRRAERDIARYIEAHGSRLTDDMERRIERHFV